MRSAAVVLGVATGIACKAGEVSTIAVTDAPPAETLPIHFRVVENGGEPGSETVSVLTERGGKSFVVLADRVSCSVLVERDLDGDGLTDAVIEEGFGGSGSHWKPLFYYVPGTMTDHFQAQEIGHGSAAVEAWRGRFSFVLVTDNEGFNHDRPEEVTRRFVFERGRAVSVEEKHAVEMKALADLRSEQFDGELLPDEERVLSFDLDGDGREDALIGRLWPRWGRFYWRVRFANRRVTEEGPSLCKRLGVLADKTLGHHDLVCDFDTRARWNGRGYE